MKKTIAALLLLPVLCLTLAGCAAQQQEAATGFQPLISQGGPPASSTGPASSAPDPTATPTATPAPAPPAEEGVVPEGDFPAIPASQPEGGPAPSAGEASESGATLYIGTRAAGFQEYPCTIAGELTPEGLIQAIADLTGWDLTLAEEVADGKGGMGVCLAGSSALYQGPPEPQKDEFHMFSAEQTAETVLDSIQKTLQENFTGAGGDPDRLDIYFYGEGEQTLSLPDLGLSWPVGQPYMWANAAPSCIMAPEG